MLKQFYRPFIMEPVCKTYRTSSWRRANTRNVSILTPYGGQFTFSTQLLTLNYLLKLLRQEPLSAENFFDVYKEQLHGFAYVGFVQLNRSIKRPDKALFWKPEPKSQSQNTRNGNNTGFDKACANRQTEISA